MAIPAMVRTTSIACGLAIVLCVAAWVKVFALPAWRDLPHGDSFTLFLLLEDTRYSGSFSEARFNMVRKGMTRAEVLALLGEPLEIIEVQNGRIGRLREKVKGHWLASYPDLPRGGGARADRIMYGYSKPGITEHWYVRSVTFSPEGKVIETEKTFYVD